MNIDAKRATVFCNCGNEHRLFPGIDAPQYWCDNEFREVKAGDYVDIEEEK